MTVCLFLLNCLLLIDPPPSLLAPPLFIRDVLSCHFLPPHQDGSRAGRVRKKTVSFSSSLSEKKISSAADCIHSMVGPSH